MRPDQYMPIQRSIDDAIRFDGLLTKLLQIDGLVMPRRIEFRTPNFVHALMLTQPECYRSSNTHVEIMKILKTVHQSFGVEPRPVSFQRFHQDAARHVTFKRHIVRRLPGEIFAEC